MNGKTQADLFQEDSKNQQRQSDFLLEEMKNLDKSKIEVVVDIGCADGSLTRKLRAFFPNAKIYGLDITAAMIEYANKQHYPEDITFIEQDIGDENLNPELKQLLGNVDLVFSNLAIHWVHVSHQKTAAVNIRKLLRSPAGKCLLNIGLLEDPRICVTPEEGKVVEYSYGPINRERALYDWTWTFQQLGFKNIRTRLGCMDYPLTGAAEYREKLIPLLPAYRSYFKPGLTEEEQSRALEALIQPIMRIAAVKPGCPPFRGDLESIREGNMEYFSI